MTDPATTNIPNKKGILPPVLNNNNKNNNEDATTTPATMAQIEEKSNINEPPYHHNDGIGKTTKGTTLSLQKAIAASATASIKEKLLPLRPSSLLVPPCPCSTILLHLNDYYKNIIITTTSNHPKKNKNTNTKNMVRNLTGCATSQCGRSGVNCRVKGDGAKFLYRYRSSPPYSIFCISSL